MLNRLMSILVGCSVGIAIIFLMEMVSQMIYPLPEGFTPVTHEDWARLMEMMPTGAIVMVMVGYVAAGFAAGIVTTVIAKENKLRNAMIAAGILTVLGAINAFAIPHPLWFRIGVLVVYFASAYAGHVVAIKLKKNA
jgi:hypothetical protein